MYFAAIVAVGWMYVTLMMALTQPSFLAGISTFVFYGLLPTAIIVYVMLAPERRKRRRAREAAEFEASRLQAGMASEPIAADDDAAPAGAAADTPPR